MGKLITPNMAHDDLAQLSGQKVMYQEDSLNAGNELDGELDESQFGPYLVTNFHDLHEHIGTITSLENRINDLLYLADDIQKASGMNQTFAMEAEKLLTGITVSVPLGFYTKETSATRYKVSLEEISKGIWTLIAAAAVALAVMIAKFISWLFSKDNKDKAAHTEPETFADIVKENEVAAVVATKYNSKLKQALAEISEMERKAHEKQYRSIDDLIDVYLISEGKDSQLSQVLNETDPLFHDIMNRGKYFEIMKSAGTKIHLVKKAAEDLISNLDSLTRTIKTESGKLAYPEDSFDFNNRTPIAIPFFDDNKELIIGEIAQRIKSVRTSVMEETTRKRIEYCKLSETFATAIKDSYIIKMLEDVDDFEHILNNLQNSLNSNAKILEDISKDKDNDLRLKHYAEALKKAIRMAREELSDIFDFLMQIKQYAKLLYDMNVRLNQVAFMAMHVLEEQLHKDKFSLSDELKNLHRELKEAFKNIS